MPDTDCTTEKLEPLSPDQKRRHLFYSAKQEEQADRHSGRDSYDYPRSFFQRESDGKIVQVNDVTYETHPFGAWDDYIYLGIGVHHHNELR